VRRSGGPVVIATGFPAGGGVPQPDGPVGAALLARALFLGVAVDTVILTDENWNETLVGTCRGTGLAPMPFPATAKFKPTEFLRPVDTRSVPKDDDGCNLVTDALLETTRPSLVISSERRGANANGLYHGLGGRPLDGMVADLDQFFRKAKRAGMPVIGIG